MADTRPGRRGRQEDLLRPLRPGPPVTEQRGKEKRVRPGFPASEAEEVIMGTGDPGGKADAERVYTRRSAWQLHDPHARVTSPGGPRSGTHGWDRAGLRPGVGQIWDSSFHVASRSTTEVPNQMPPCPGGTPVPAWGQARGGTH